MSSRLTATANWQSPTPTTTRAIAPDNIHLWRVGLTRSPAELAACNALLSPNERKRRDRLRGEPLQRRFAIARGILRYLLGRYLKCHPAAIQFGYGDRGKPYLAEPADALQFNLSHSHELALYAIAPPTCRAIGIDVEQLRSRPNADRLARRFFSPREADAIAALAGTRLDRDFLRLWTAKEAYLKATGAGLRGAIEQVEVDLSSPIGQAQLLGADNWTLQELALGNSYIGAVAIRDRDWKFAYWDLDLRDRAEILLVD
ncbi:phosphopantetheinyl transferase [Rubidibacter lacunae KORDI 51-2]|uniref:Phosphopantetheinyl transferase n=1 Tax=Rubidibacter lacunae KORDI 51-2 TaxID=582515 RepID=U5DLH7_9CHRO|nr:4'-phosphopantetheinyl transferase superfamily protein [Rubidibacter lacunae]ERN42526.1 phosphopantetheinyl transferase [Rubidibacter lacunae KORDI 51-2]